MPLDRLQSAALRAIASNRNPESYIAGGVALNREGPRFSRDIDIFNDEEARLAATALADAAALEAAGFAVAWRPVLGAGKRGALVSGLGLTTEIDWSVDSDFRFFPALPDALFGFVLHPVDLATNKAAAAADRRAPRDIVDLLTIDATILPLGAVLSAAVGRFPGQTPEALLAEIARRARFTLPEFAALATEMPLDPVELQGSIRAMLERAETWLASLPCDAVGFVFLDDSGTAMAPAPGGFERFHRHEGARRGHWPGSSAIARAMLERYSAKETR